MLSWYLNEVQRVIAFATIASLVVTSVVAFVLQWRRLPAPGRQDVMLRVAFILVSVEGVTAYLAVSLLRDESPIAGIVAFFATLSALAGLLSVCTAPRLLGVTPQEEDHQTTSR